MTPKRKAVHKPALDPRYVLGQLCYLDGTMQPRCRVCFGGEGYTDAPEHAPGCMIPQMKDAAEMLWIVLANVSGGDWTQQSVLWQEMAAKWRDNYFRVFLDGSAVTPSTNAVDPHAQPDTKPTPRAKG